MTPCGEFTLSRAENTWTTEFDLIMNVLCLEMFEKFYIIMVSQETLTKEIYFSYLMSMINVDDSFNETLI